MRAAVPSTHFFHTYMESYTREATARTQHDNLYLVYEARLGEASATGRGARAAFRRLGVPEGLWVHAPSKHRMLHVYMHASPPTIHQSRTALVLCPLCKRRVHSEYPGPTPMGVEQMNTLRPAVIMGSARQVTAAS